MSEETAFRPTQRPRDQRRGQAERDEAVWPLFVRPGERLARPVSSMPGIEQMSADVAVETMRRGVDRGLDKYILFGVVDAKDKDATGSAAMDPDNPVHTTLRAAREAKLPVTLIADLCFCEYTDHGHCGHLHPDQQVAVDNDPTIDALGEQAVALARSGADIVAPSAMMDGQVGAIDRALRGANLRRQTEIFSYSIKFASHFYGPFREAGEGAPKFGDRRGYQMDFRRSDEWETELQLDLAEGADRVMVKPAGPYLDILAKVRGATDRPVGAYQVSGEYSSLHAAAEAGCVDLKEAALETLYAIRRAGADWIVTYFSPRLPDWL